MGVHACAAGESFPLAKFAVPSHNTAMQAFYGNFWFSTARYFYFKSGGAGGSV